MFHKHFYKNTNLILCLFIFNLNIKMLYIFFFELTITTNFTSILIFTDIFGIHSKLCKCIM